MILLLVGVAIVLFVVYKYWHFRTHYPPGPWPLPLIGNSLDLRGIDRWEDKFIEWKNKYGNIYTTVLGVLPIVTVNDYDSIIEMFVKDGDSYSDRFTIKSFQELTRKGSYGIIETSGDLWREQRRFALKTLRDFGLGKNQMQDLILEEIQSMFERVNKSIESGITDHNFHDHTDLAIGSVINNVICGYRFTTNEKEQEFYRLKKSISKMMKIFTDPLVSMALFIGILRKIPPFSTRFHEGVNLFNEIFDYLDNEIEKHRQRNDYNSLTDPRDYIDAFLIEKAKLDEKDEAHYFSQDQLRNTLVDLWFAGQETSTNTITWCVCFMIQNQDVQQKLHEELDRVIGSERMITVADKQDLPYTSAVVMETQRLASIISLNSLRATNRDVDVYGFHLPKGTIIIPQISVLMYDPKIFPNPKRFYPDRFINANGQVEHHHCLMPFSVGKRQCPGEGLAKMELYLFIANMFNQYKFTAGKTPPTGKKEHSGASMGTVPYTCKIERRFQ